jgi:predicted permease
MSWIDALFARARSIGRPRAADERMDEEFSFHVDMETERLITSGLAPNEARRRALVAFGGVQQHRETMRDGRGTRWLDDLRADVRYALRATRRSPGFAIAVAVTLGIGIGVNGLAFGYINSLLFRPVVARDAGQLVGLFGLDVRSGQAQELNWDDYLDFRDRSGVFDGLAGMTGVPLNLVASVSASQTADMVWGEMVTENFFTVLGMQPVVGRLFAASDAPQGANAFAVLSYDSWIKRFHGDSSVVGRIVRINGAEFTITGVAARGFKGMRTFGFWPEMWVPAGMHDVIIPNSTGMLEGRGRGWLMAFGRMHDGWDMRRTSTAASAYASQLAHAYPATNASIGARLLPSKVGFDHPSFVDTGTIVLASAMGIFAAVIVLLIICANLANLQLARSAARSREIAIRLSLGCSRARLTRQLLVESALLVLPGLAIAALMLRSTNSIERMMVPHLQFQVGMAAEPDARVITFTGVIALVAAMLFGLVPALRATRPSLAPSLSSVIGEKRRTKHPMRMRGTLVVGQLALSVILIVAGMLFVRSLIAARTADVGFDPHNRLLMSVNVGLQGYDETRGRRFYDEVLTRTRALPRVLAATWAFPVPFDTYGRGARFSVEGVMSSEKDHTVGTNASVVAEDFVESLGLRLQGGRLFAVTDSVGAPRVMIVNRSLANRFWPGKDPIGQHARSGDASGPVVMVIGVVADAKFATIGEGSRDRVYLPLRQNYRDWETMIVKTRGEPMAVLPQVQRVIAGFDPTLPTFGTMTMDDSVESGFSTSRTAVMIAGFFGILALLIASVGLYAVVASSVVERTQEIGVRIALGATPMRVLLFVMRGGARLGAWGLGLGLIGAVFVAQAMAGLLYGFSPSDPMTFALVAVVLALVVLVATYLPGRRAVKMDPVRSLRSE